MREMGESSYQKSDRGKTCVQLIYEKCVGQQIEFECIGHEKVENNLIYFTMQCSINGTVSDWDVPGMQDFCMQTFEKFSIQHKKLY